MLPAHLARMLNHCIHGIYADQDVRDYVQTRCIPELNRYRREVLAGSFAGRHARPAGYIAGVIERSTLIRRVLNHAHAELTRNGVQSNVVQVQFGQGRRDQRLAS